MRASPDDLCGPNPNPADLLLQVQQTNPQEGESQPQSAEKMDTDAMVGGREASDHERRARREQGRVVEEEVGEEDQAAGEETADEGLPLSKGSGDEAEEGSASQKEPPDANNNSMETPQNCQDNFITIPEITEQVSVECFMAFSPESEKQLALCFILKVDQEEETYCSDEIEVVLVDNSGPGPAPSALDDCDTVKIIITMSCDPQTAAQLEESVKQRLLENTQVRTKFHSYL